MTRLESRGDHGTGWPRARRLYHGRNPARAVGIWDLRAMALARLPAFAAEYLEGGAEDEWTVVRNRQSFEHHELVPRVLRNVEHVDPETTLLGRPTRLPIVIAPTGFAGLFWRNADQALANAAVAAGIPFTQSIASNARLEDIARTSGLRHWLQLYMYRDRETVRAMVDRAIAAQCEALVVTVDGPVGNREWDRRCYAPEAKLNWRFQLETLRHPRWLAQVLRHGIPDFANFREFVPAGAGFAQLSHWLRGQVDPTFCWDDLAWLRSVWPRQLIVKGLSCTADVSLAHEIGVQAVVLSNHGGRQLNGAPPPLEVLSEVAATYKGKIELMVDSGFRRGTDIVKALALGADAVMIGRAVLYGVAAAGESGVSRLLAILRDEIARTMAQLGVSTVTELGSRQLRAV
jgi:(S)-mandelate dehydrogenase